MSKKIILVAEDSVELLWLLSRLLISQGYEVRGVSDGQAALKVIAEEKPHLVILDGIMPLVNGFEVCRQIKSDPSTQHTPVILITVKNSSTDIAKGKEVRADCYITKPFKSAQIIDAVQIFLPQSSAFSQFPDTANPSRQK